MYTREKGEVKRERNEIFIFAVCRYNEWVEESRIVRKVTNPTKHARPPYKVTDNHLSPYMTSYY